MARRKKIVICIDCKEEKPHYALGLCGLCYRHSYNRRYHKDHPRDRRAYYRGWREEHPDYQRSYYEENLEKILAYACLYREVNRENILAFRRRWGKENPDKIVVNSALRRARKHSLPDTLTSGQAEHLFRVAQAIYPGEELQLDHIVPLSKGGGTTLANMHVIPARLNQSKADALPQEVYRQVELF